MVPPRTKQDIYISDLVL